MGPAQGGWRSLGISVCLGYKLAAKVDTFKMLPRAADFLLVC